MEEDKGHDGLIKDLNDILMEADNFHFHDFKNSRYATPKVELVLKLQTIINRARNGRYDN